MAVREYDDTTHTVISSAPFCGSDCDGSNIEELELTIKLPVKIYWYYEDDDDGCGSPSTTGNSMTGRRGRHKVVVDASVTPNDLSKAVTLALVDIIKNHEM